MALLPLAQRLQRALGAATPLAAVVAVVNNALGDVRDCELLRAVTLCDFEGLTTHAAAARLSLSPRQFFRYRAEAVAALVDCIEHTLETREPGMRSAFTLLADAVRLSDPQLSSRLYCPGALDGIERRYRFLRTETWQGAEPSAPALPTWPEEGLQLLCRVEWCTLRGRYAASVQALRALRDRLRTNAAKPGSPFIATQLLRLEFEATQRTGDANRRAAILSELSALARREPATAAGVRLIEAEALACQGDTMRAATLLADGPLWAASDPETLTGVALTAAKCAYLRGRDEEALDFATAVLRIAPADAMLCGAAHALIAMAMLHLHRAWTPPEGDFGYHAAMLEAVTARQLLAADRYGEAAAAAHSAFNAACRHEASAVGAYALATLSFAEELLGDVSSAQATRLRAFDAFATSRDAVVARDIFLWPGLAHHDLGAMRVDLRFAELLWSFKERVFPEYRKPVHQRVRHLQIANLQRRCLLACRGDGENGRRNESLLHADALALLTAMRHAGIDPDAALGLARTTLRAHWFPSAAFLPMHEREPYRRAFMFLAENFYTSIERHYRSDVAACSLCADADGAGAASCGAEAEDIISA